jgi:hypothetical protein
VRNLNKGWNMGFADLKPKICETATSEEEEEHTEVGNMEGASCPGPNEYDQRLQKWI